MIHTLHAFGDKRRRECFPLHSHRRSCSIRRNTPQQPSSRVATRPLISGSSGSAPRPSVPYRPGQYVTLGLQLDGRIIERPYSICSSPTEDEIELFIERVPDGELSDPLFALGVGGELIVRKRTKGLFLRDAPMLDQPHLFVATVTGVAPFVSLLRTLASRARTGDWTPMPIVTLQGAATVRRARLRRRADRARARVRLVHLRPDRQPALGRPGLDRRARTGRGRRAQARRPRRACGRGNGGVFLCGHPGMISGARAIMRRAGFDDKAIREEQYWPD